MALRRSLPDCQPTGSYVSISWLLILTSMVTWPIRRLPQNFHQRYLSCNVLALIRNQCCPRRVRRDYNDLRAQVTRIPSDLEQGLGSGMKQQVIDQPFVL
jgi:hypothetical protein